jgi:glutamine amidotransferase
VFCILEFVFVSVYESDKRMCRFFAYIGPQVLAEDLLYKPRFSLILAQSMQAEEMSVMVNGDGFGVGWYQPELDPNPCVFRSVKPAWSDANLRHLAKKVYSPLIFGHVRAASPGMPVEEVNSHPFHCGRLMFMHNGMVGDFTKIRRKLLHSLNDTAYDAIEGSTDSEHLFGLFLNHIRDPFGDVSCDEIITAMHNMLEDFSRLFIECGVKKHSYLNLCVTNGKSIVAMRYTTNPHVQPASLYYMYGKRYFCEGDNCQMEPSLGNPSSIVIASEPFTLRRSDWMKVERNAMMIVDESMKIRFQSVHLPVEKVSLEENYGML